MVITGDIHAAGLGELHADPMRPADTPAAAVELVTTSITTATSDSYASLVETAAALSPGVRYADARHRGYVLCDLTPETLTAQFRTVDTSLAAGSAPAPCDHGGDMGGGGRPAHGRPRLSPPAAVASAGTAAYR